MVTKIVDKAAAEVEATTPKVMEALGSIKFLLVTIPVACVIIALLMQTVTHERNIGIIAFKMGTFATPQNPEPVMLAGENQVRLRLRQFADEIQQVHPGSFLITTLIENDVVTVTGIDSGDYGTKQYLTDLVQKEIDFQNRRFDDYSRAQKKRMQGLEENLENFTRQREQLQRRINETRDPIAMLAMQQGIDNASSRISSIRLELDTHEYLHASDLYIDTTQIIRDPIIVASSNWYRPIIFGAVGLAIGLFLTLVIAIIAVLRACSSKKKTRQEEKKAQAQKSKPATESSGSDESS